MPTPQERKIATTLPPMYKQKFTEYCKKKGQLRSAVLRQLVISFIDKLPEPAKKKIF